MGLRENLEAEAWSMNARSQQHEMLREANAHAYRKAENAGLEAIRAALQAARDASGGDPFVDAWADQAWALAQSMA